MSAAHLLDTEQLSTLRMLRNGTLLPQLIRAYRVQAQLQLENVAMALTAGDTKTIFEIAHSLKSASFSLGATQLGQLCATLEQAALRADLQHSATLIESLQSSFTALLPELARHEQS